MCRHGPSLDEKELLRKLDRGYICRRLSLEDDWVYCGKKSTKLGEDFIEDLESYSLHCVEVLIRQGLAKFDREMVTPTQMRLFND
jgi:hypothetical protein